MNALNSRSFITLILCTLLTLISASSGFAQTLSFNVNSGLTDQEVNDAIMLSQGRHRLGLVLNDKQTAFFTAMACPTCAESGYSIHVYAPAQWIGQMARNAARELLPFSLKDVTPPMRQKMLHVVAMPSTPEYLNGNGFALSSSVHRIVLADTTRSLIIQPLALGNGVVTTNSALRSAEFNTAIASFNMDDVEKLRALDGKGEFFIAVTGERQNKFFRVKQRFFKSLFE